MEDTYSSSLSRGQAISPFPTSPHQTARKPCDEWEGKKEGEGEGREGKEEAVWAGVGARAPEPQTLI